MSEPATTAETPDSDPAPTDLAPTVLFCTDTFWAERGDELMAIDPALSEVLACPACGTRLTGASCLPCRIDFPEIDGIPWLMPEPALAAP